MSELDKDQDQQWLDALAGRPSRAGDAKQRAQAMLVRRALIRQRERLDIEGPSADEAMRQRLLSRLAREGLLDSEVPTADSSPYRARVARRAFSWKALAIYVLTAFAIGSATTRMMMISTVPATRSSGSVVEMAGGHAQQVVLRVDDPIQTAQAAVAEAVKQGLVVAVDSDASGYRVLIDGFVPQSPDQEVLRRILGLDKSAAGKLLFVLQKRPAP